MSDLPAFEHLLVIPRLRVQNANAISSPLTHGFPSITAFIGLMWALERKTKTAGLDLQFQAVGVIAHDTQEQVTDSSFVQAYRLTRNPIDKSGKSAGIVEEGRVHLDISLVFALQSSALENPETASTIAKQVREIISQMRIAGGSVIESTVSQARQRPYVIAQTGDTEGKRRLFDQLKMRLLPGFALVERHDLLDKRLEQLRASEPSANRLDAWLSLARINWQWQTGAEGKGQWQHDRQGLGWIVPIPVGYGALGALQPAGSVANARDRTLPFCFVESLYGIGEWLSPHRLDAAEQLLWFADSQPENGAYRCRNNYQHVPVIEFD